MEAPILFSRSSKPFTPSEPIPFSGKFIRQTSTSAQYAHVEAVLEPLPRGDDRSLFSWEVAESAVPREFRDAVLDGITRALEAEDSPCDCLRATRIRVVGGSFSQVDSSDRAFATAANIGIKDALRRALADRSPL